MLHLIIPRTLTLIALVLSLFLFSCRPSEENEPEPVLQQQWLVYKTASSDVATVENGYAYLSSHYESVTSPAFTLVQSINKLKGDFELTISYSACSPEGGLLEANKNAFTMDLFADGVSRGVINTFIGKEVMMLTDSSKTQNILDPATNIKFASGTSGQLYIKREGSKFTAWLTSGEGNKVVLEKENYFTQDLSFSFSITSKIVGTPMSVKIDDISIKGSTGGLSSEAFDKNTFGPAIISQ